MPEERDEMPSDTDRPDAPSDERRDSDAALAAENHDAPLAAVVDKPRTEAAIESLRIEGVYDDDRRVREYDAETVALPVTDPPADTHIREVIRQVDPDYRSRDLEDLLAERGWSEADRERAPGSWAVIGSVVLVDVPENCPDESELAEALLELHGEADSVLADEGIANDGEAGIYREPRTRLLAGTRDTETVHAEHGIQYGLDPARVMFSPGNQAERARMGEVVEGGSRSPDREREHVFDMFAGIGYFTLPMARAGALVTATEINPTAFRYLLENAVSNDVADRVDAYRADCRDLAGDLDVDRVVMGYYGYDDEDGPGTRTDSAEAGAPPASERAPETRPAGAHGSGTRTAEAREFLPAALEALRSGGIVHYHEATPESRLWDRPLERLETAAAADGRSLEVLDRRRVKSHSAGVSHVVIDARLD